MKNLFKRKSLAFLGIAVFLVGGFFVSNKSALADDVSYNGNIIGNVTANGLAVTGNISGDFNAVIAGEIGSTVPANSAHPIRAYFSGTISGDINGNISGGVNYNGHDTLFAEITGSGASGYVYLIGDFQGHNNGDFVARIVTQDNPISFISDIVISGGNSVAVGNQLQLLADTDVLWEVYVNDASKASIDQNGLLTANATGTVIVIASATDGSLLTKNLTVTITPVFNGNITGNVGANSSNQVSGLTVGDFNTTITGILTGGVDGQWATFAGNISGDIVGNMTGKINWNGADTLFAEITNSGAVGHVYLIGQFDGPNGHFNGRFITQLEVINFTTEITVAGDNSVMMGDSLQLTATTDGSSQEVAWSIWTGTDSSYGSATIDQDGLVTPTGVGRVIVIASALDGSLITKNYEVNILPDTVAPVITILPYDSTNPAKTITVNATTNEGTLNTDSHIFTSNSSFDFVATDEVGNISTTTVTIANIVDEDQTVPDEDGEVLLDLSTPEVIVSSSTKPLNISLSADSDEALVNYSTLISSGAGLIPQTTINSNLATIFIPASTITSASTTWDGILSAPKITTVDLPVTSGKTNYLSSAIEIGFSGAKLSFDKAVRIVMPGQAGKKVGYTRSGENFIEITNVCLADSQAVGDALSADSECKIDSGSDLVIWTKHFTTFATYTQTTNVSSGGGGSYINYCSSVSYGDWGSNINGFQYRDVVTKYPSGCSLTTNQQLDKSRVYVAEVSEPIISPVATTTNTSTKQVLGEKKYSNGTLIKGSNNKIYVVKDDSLVYIPNLKELAKHQGPILKVEDDVIASFSKTENRYSNGALIRAKGDIKIYVIENGKKSHIKTLKDLKAYLGQEIISVEVSDLDNY